MNCRQCRQAAAGNYCGNCGQPLSLKRVDGHYILHEIQHILHFEKGIPLTVRAMLFHPGQSIRAFISEDRSRLVKPVIYIILTSLAYSLTAHFFHIDNGYGKAQAGHQASGTISGWIEGHYGYANIIMGLFIGAWLKLLRRKSAYNFFELLIMLCFVMGTGMLLYTLFTLVQGLTGINLIVAASIATLAYSAWAIGQFLNEHKAVSYVLAALAYILGMISFSTLAFLGDLLLGSFHKA